MLAQPTLQKPEHARGGNPAGFPKWNPMFNVSRTALTVIAVIALVLLVLGLATDVGLFGWVIAIILGAYVVAAFVRGQRAA